jgi:hypothetical protein
MRDSHLCLILCISTVLAQSPSFAAQPSSFTAQAGASSEVADTVRKVIAEVQADNLLRNNIEVRVTDDFRVRVAKLLARVKANPKKRTTRFKLFFENLVNFALIRQTRSLSPHVESLGSRSRERYLTLNGGVCSATVRPYISQHWQSEDYDLSSQVLSYLDQHWQSEDGNFNQALSRHSGYQSLSIGSTLAITDPAPIDSRVITIGEPELFAYLDEGHCGENPCKMECNPCNDQCDWCARRD